MTRYAQNTTVSVEKSIGEIRATIARFGGNPDFGCGEQRGYAVVMFNVRNMAIRFNAPLPDPGDRGFTHSSVGRRKPEAAHKLWDQSCRTVWRELALLIKAKLVAVSRGINTFDKEFLGNILLPDGITVGEAMVDHVKNAYLTGGSPRLMLPVKE